MLVLNISSVVHAQKYYSFCVKLALGGYKKKYYPHGITIQKYLWQQFCCVMGISAMTC